MSRKPFIISVPEPCSQNWDAMTTDGNGRHCDHCQKKVIDFTEFSDAAIHKFFRTNGPACGRFLATQLDRPLNIPKQPDSRLYRLAIACGLTLLFTPSSSASYGQSNLQSSAQSPAIKNDSNNWSLQPIGKITGKVVTDGNRPAANATVTATRDGKIMGTAVTDLDGRYEIFPLTVGTYSVKAVVDQYNQTESRGDIQVTNEDSTVCDLRSMAYVNLTNYQPPTFTGTAMMPINQLIITTDVKYWVSTPKKKKKHKHGRHH